MAYQYGACSKSHTTPFPPMYILIIELLLLLLLLSRTGISFTTKASDQAPSHVSLLSDTMIDDHLHVLNRPSVRSIKSSDGDTIDCVPIHLQLAFDHPRLKNHKIQKKPSSKFAGVREKGRSNTVWQLWRQSGSCPLGTIPTRRISSQDLLRAGSLEKYGQKSHSPAMPTSLQHPQPSGDGQAHEHAISYVVGDQYFGAQASINVWKPTVQVPTEFSLSQIWLLGGSFDGDLNSIEAGWQVSPEIYGDSNPRLFTYWTSDAYQATGCYNLLCSGFIQVTNSIAVGASISPVSSFNGTQYDIQILIWKDPNSGNWWMRFGGDTLVGYWPAELFSHLTEAATMIQWGGEIVNTRHFGQHTTTQMGSGLFPQSGFSEASYFRNLGYVDADNQLTSGFNLHTVAEHPNCYSIQLSDTDAEWGDYFYYGGPGRNPNCP